MIRIGKRKISETFKQIFSLDILTTVFRFFIIHEKPFNAIFNEFFSMGKYPVLIRIKKKIEIKLYSFSDFSTLNLIFCRQDYFKPKNIELVIDIGSNIGISCLYWLVDNPNCIVHSYEPSSKNYKRLFLNTKKYNKNIKNNKFGVSSKNENLRLYLSKSGVNDSVQKIPGAKYEKIKLIDINKILKKALLVENKIDVLKIDVEGKEREILKNIKKKYFNKIRVINIEGNNFDNIVPSYFAHSFKGSASRFINMKV